MQQFQVDYRSDDEEDTQFNLSLLWQLLHGVASGQNLEYLVSFPDWRNPVFNENRTRPGSFGGRLRIYANKVAADALQEACRRHRLAMQGVWVVSELKAADSPEYSFHRIQVKGSTHSRTQRLIRRAEKRMAQGKRDNTSLREFCDRPQMTAFNQLRLKSRSNGNYYYLQVFRTQGFNQDNPSNTFGLTTGAK